MVSPQPSLMPACTSHSLAQLGSPRALQKPLLVHCSATRCYSQPGPELFRTGSELAPSPPPCWEAEQKNKRKKKKIICGLKALFLLCFHGLCQAPLPAFPSLDATCNAADFWLFSLLNVRQN